MSTSDRDELDLRQIHQHALDYLHRYEITVRTLEGQLNFRNEQIATLEEKIVHMSFELASSKAFEDKHDSNRRTSRSDVSFRNTDDDNEVFSADLADVNKQHHSPVEERVLSVCLDAGVTATSINARANTSFVPSSPDNSCSGGSSTKFQKLFRKKRDLAILPVEEVPKGELPTRGSAPSPSPENGGRKKRVPRRGSASRLIPTAWSAACTHCVSAGVAQWQQKDACWNKDGKEQNIGDSKKRPSRRRRPSNFRRTSFGYVGRSFTTDQ